MSEKIKPVINSFLSACIKKTESTQTNDLMLHLKLLEKQE
jgi:hypothetical protein